MSEAGKQSNVAKGEVPMRARIRETISRMPPLNHWPDREQAFDVTQSEVSRWLLANLGEAELLQVVFDYARSEELIYFSRETKLWRGMDETARAARAAERAAALAEKRKRRSEEAAIARQKREEEGKKSKEERGANRRRPGRKTQFSDNYLLDILDAYEEAHDGRHPTSPELLTWVFQSNLCGRAVYFRRLNIARATGLVEDVREMRDGKAVMVLRRPKPAQTTPPAINMDDDVL